MASKFPWIWLIANHATSFLQVVYSLTYAFILYLNRLANCSAKKEKLLSFASWSYMETITSWQMQICWQISSRVCVCVCASVHIHMCVVTLEHKENNCHWNVTRFHLTSVLCISQATSGRKRRNDCQAHALQLKPLCMRMPARLKISWESSVKVAERERLFVCHSALIPQKYGSVIQIKKAATHIMVHDVWGKRRDSWW